MTNYVTMVNGMGMYGKCHVFYSKFTHRSGNAPVAIVHHAHLGSADDVSNELGTPGFYHLIKHLALNGYVVAVGDFKKYGPSGNSAQWGNTDNHAGIDEARTFAARYGGSPTKKMFLAGWSMGALSVLSYAGLYPNNVAGVLGIVPAIDIAAYKTPGEFGPFDTDGNPFSFAYTIDPAYNGNYFNGEYGRDHNPQEQARITSNFNNMPIDLWYAKNDTYASRDLIRLFYNEVKGKNSAAPITMRQIPGPTDGHTSFTSGLVPATEIVAFAKSCVT